MKKFGLVLLLSVIFINSYAVASETPTKTWMEGCKPNDSLYIACKGYFASLHSAQEFAYLAALESYRDILVILDREEIVKDTKKFEAFNKRAISTSKMLYGCIEGKSVEQMMAVFVKWAENNPSKWHLTIGESITESLVQAFPPPCE